MAKKEQGRNVDRTTHDGGSDGGGSPRWVGVRGAVVFAVMAVLVGMSAWPLVVELMEGKQQGRGQTAAPPAAPTTTRPSHAAHDTTQDCAGHLARALAAAQKSMQHRAVLELNQCIELEPVEPNTLFQIGEVFVMLGEYDEGLDWISRATALDPGNYHFLTRLIDVANKAGEPEAAVQAAERGLETLLHLDSDTWHRTLLQTADAPPEDMQWLLDESAEVLLLLRSLVRLYEQVEWMPAANAAHKILSKLFPHDTHAQQRFADFSAGIGLIGQSINVSLASLQAEYERQYPRHDARQPVVDHALVLLGASLDAIAINIARKLLLVEDAQVLQLMSDVCGHDVTDLLSAHQIPLSRAIHFMESCIAKQDVIGTLIKLGAKTTGVSTDFLFTPLHSAAAISANAVIDTLVQANADISATNTLHQTPFHAAIIRGQEEGGKKDLLNMSAANRAGPTDSSEQCADMVCLHRWAGFEWLLDNDEDCTRPEPPYTIHKLPHRPSSTTVGGGWKIKRSVSRQPATCDFDVVDARVFTQEDFLLDFLSLQRPLLVKGALNSHHWDRVRASRWTRENFASEFRDTVFQRTIIPYASAFGMEANETSVLSFLEYMEDHYAASIKNIEDIELPAYIFASLPTQSPSTKTGGEDGEDDGGNGDDNDEDATASASGSDGIHRLAFRDFQIPECIGPHVSEIETRTKQFYLGPAGSGAPMHVHSGSWNALVYGRKRWFLLPPPLAIYSKQHPHDFIDEQLPALRARGAVLECIQESGDVVFVPEMWAHAVLNEAESIGFASEFAWGGNAFSLPAPDDVDDGSDGDDDGEEEETHGR
ncbi:hypothetical protein PTSG_08691 [Salpingoeca rosetta]|uniref:JmjC domain-containing protein n=1 Tax=Salpingoeca rosetta (strain ATCC 50818 / BSB-021) TaxID=946362 RepID=F2UKE5_SALR5|nr:uncharacterized protein PTSG_08691 [Salpingoeca rosetta]EGD77594.1 hypothetical protein PTSG_08691 [Salpingoeca rosetta]|eukprot:XP_004990482.1 hypothetical protein PTSG_08691 [Salpingoeca rosetta]